jgi:hypothetical protein
VSAEKTEKKKMENQAWTWTCRKWKDGTQLGAPAPSKKKRDVNFRENT